MNQKQMKILAREIETLDKLIGRAEEAIATSKRLIKAMRATFADAKKLNERGKTIRRR